MKYVHDTMASELDWIRLCERLGTEERVMTEMDAQDPEAATQLELKLKVSLFREGFFRAVAEQCGHTNLWRPSDKGMHNDADWAAGYSSGSTITELAMENYRQMLIGGGK